MPAQIIAFPKSEGNGAREALTDVERSFGDGETIGLSWAVLGCLGLIGFWQDSGSAALR
jgi:hypothetical protein